MPKQKEIKELNEGWEGLQLTSAPFLLLHPEQLFFQLLWGSWPFSPLFFLYKYLASCCLNQPGLGKVCILNGQDVSTLSKWLRVCKGCNFFKRIQTGCFPLKKGIIYPPRFICLSVSACAYVSLAPFFLSPFLMNYIFEVKKSSSIGFY